MQTTILFSLPPVVEGGAIRRESDWRRILVDRGAGTYEALNAVRIVALREMLWLMAGSPEASDWLNTHLDALAGAVTDEMGVPIPMDVRSRQVGVRACSDKLWAYRLPRFVIEKKTGDWAEHFGAPLSEPRKAQLRQRLEAAICRELSTWGRLPVEIEFAKHFLVVTDPGRAMPIPAIQAERSGHGKAVNVLTRTNVQFLSYWRFEGELVLGPLASLGFGRMLRTQAPAILSPVVQRELLSALPEEKEFS